MIKLDLGAGPVSPPGFRPMGNAHGSAIYPLSDIADGSVDEIRASHVLEHFPNSQVVDVLKHWVGKLKPGGVLKVAVPNLEWIAKAYLDGVDAPIMGYLMGGQTAPDDFHQSTFDTELLAEALRLAGLIEVKPWKSELQDCAALPVSLNLQAFKPRPLVGADGKQLKISAIMSVPRLGFMDNFFCVQEALPAMGVKVQRFTGAFWEQCMERGLQAALADQQPDLILTLDYDTVFKRFDVERLVQTMAERPEIDALAPIQSARWSAAPLLTMDPPLGMKNGQITPDAFLDDVTRIRTAHFGLTLFRASSLAKLPRPWLWSQPAPDQTWGAERVDADIYFWKQWAAAGLSLYSANRVAVGHLELMVLWPGADDFSVIPQLASAFQKTGKPEGTWK